MCRSENLDKSKYSASRKNAQSRICFASCKLATPTMAHSAAYSCRKALSAIAQGPCIARGMYVSYLLCLNAADYEQRGNMTE